MAELIDNTLQRFENYHHKFFIEMTDLHQKSNLQFHGEFLDDGKRFDDNQPGVSGKPLDKTYYGSRSIFHYFCNRTKAMTGVSGGMMYEYNGIYLYIGFSNPLAGSRKCFVELKQEKETAKWAYKQLQYRDDKISTCCGWKVKAAFESTKKPKLKVTVGKDDKF